MGLRADAGRPKLQPGEGVVESLVFMPVSPKALGEVDLMWTPLMRRLVIAR